MNENKKKYILTVTYLLLVVFIVSAFVLHREIWAVDSLVFGVILYAIYLFRKPFNLTDFLFLLLAMLVIMHCSAVFGFFSVTFFGHEYDTYVHAASSIVIALTAFNYMLKFKVSLIETAFFALLITLGTGLSNELVEFAGYKLFGRGEGIFLLGPGDIGAENVFENLMTDFFNDFYGNITGIILSLGYHFKADKPNT